MRRNDGMKIYDIRQTVTNSISAALVATGTDALVVKDKEKQIQLKHRLQSTLSNSEDINDIENLAEESLLFLKQKNQPPYSLFVACLWLQKQNQSS